MPRITKCLSVDLSMKLKTLELHNRTRKGDRFHKHTMTKRIAHWPTLSPCNSLFSEWLWLLRHRTTRWRSLFLISRRITFSPIPPSQEPFLSSRRIRLTKQYAVASRTSILRSSGEWSALVCNMPPTSNRKHKTDGFHSQSMLDVHSADSDPR